MKHVTLFSGKRLFLRLALAAAMIVFGGEKVWADTDIFNGTVVEGWTYNGPVSSSTISSYAGTTVRKYTSNSVVEIAPGQTIVISAKKYLQSGTGQIIKVKYSSNNGDTWTTAKEFAPTDNSNYAEFVVDNLEGTYKIEFEFAYVYINSIIIKDALTTPILSVSPTSVAFGEITGNNSRTITVSNTGAGTMDVTIANDNTTDFTVPPTELTGIGAGESKTFSVTFNFDEDNLGDKSANITVTPDYAEGAAVVILVTATSVEVDPDYTFDESEASSWSTSYDVTKRVLLKYTPVNGWNTFCVPFSPSGHMDDIFGTGWKAYMFKSYNDGTITFAKQKDLSNSTPYLVYVENAASHPSGVLLETTNIYTTTPGHTDHDGVTFQGTYAPMAAGSLEGCYGVTGSGQIAKGSDKAWMNGYRAYLTGIPDGSSVKMFVIDGDDATDIGLMQMVEGEDKAVYNISGQRVQKARKGLYIIGGKKVIIK